MILRQRRTRTLKSESGAELIEMALTLPLLLFALMAIVDFGLLFDRTEVLHNAAREGARLAGRGTESPAAIEARVLDYMATSGLPAGGSVVVTPTTFSAAGLTFDATQVDVFHFHDFTFMAPLAPWFGGSFGQITLNAQATMRLEAAP